VSRTYIEKIKEKVKIDSEKTSRKSIVSSLLYERKLDPSGSEFDISDDSLIG
jgi:hypothetical protein